MYNLIHVFFSSFFVILPAPIHSHLCFMTITIKLVEMVNDAWLALYLVGGCFILV